MYISYCIRSYIELGFHVIIHSAIDIGALVRAQRKEYGWSQKELATKADVSPLWLSQFERGKRTAHVGLVLRTLRELDLAIRIERRSKATLTVDRVPLIDLDTIVGENTNRSGE